MSCGTPPIAFSTSTATLQIPRMILSANPLSVVNFSLKYMSVFLEFFTIGILSYRPAPANPGRSSPLESDRKMSPPPKSPMLLLGSECTIGSPEPSFFIENPRARPGKFPTRVSPSPITTSAYISEVSPLAGLTVWITKAYSASTSLWISTAICTWWTGMLDFLQLQKALSFHLDAQTPFRAAKASSHCLPSSSPAMMIPDFSREDFS
mmetsp:Transcript_5729/g.13325  ORF Transcript_5729/g.13325 Transcript_5729/m.13325 type:complete len:208 (+) Transcript_5729:516-1139(+)